jgi:hypothetical protein
MNELFKLLKSKDGFVKLLKDFSSKNTDYELNKGSILKLIDKKIEDRTVIFSFIDNSGTIHHIEVKHINSKNIVILPDGKLAEPLYIEE